ncbi:hypothetical protein NHQ30_002164 [Ciborinia camelliae]|nr:hypothetical protein NHQ30_002164 [Ciborinia camelliae]
MSSTHDAKPKKHHQKPLQDDKSPANRENQPSTSRSISDNRQHAKSAAEEGLVDILLNRKPRCQKKGSRSKSKGCSLGLLWKKFVIWVMEIIPASSLKLTLRLFSPNTNPDLVKMRRGERVDAIDTNSSAQGPYLTPMANGEDHKVNTRVAPVDISPQQHPSQQAYFYSLPSVEFVETPKHKDPTEDTNSEPSPQLRHPSRRSNIMSPENEAKVDKIMERVTGINCRRGLGMQNEMDSSSSYGYGFYWTCCNNICLKARVMGTLGGVMEVAVKGPVSCLHFCIGECSSNKYTVSFC